MFWDRWKSTRDSVLLSNDAGLISKVSEDVKALKLATVDNPIVCDGQRMDKQTDNCNVANTELLHSKLC